MARNHALARGCPAGGPAAKFLSESRRRRVPPLLGMALAATALFGAFLAWIFLGDDRSPEDLWRQEVVPAIERMRKAEARGDWEGALRACDEAIAKGRELGRDFSSRIPDLKGKRRELLERIEGERQAEAEAARFRAEVDRFMAADPASDPPARYRRARELVREGEGLLRGIAGTRSGGGVQSDLERLKTVPEPPPPPDVKREIDAAIARHEYGEALRLAAKAGPEGRKFMIPIESRAAEYVRHRYPPDATPGDRVREVGREKLLAELREDLRRVAGTSSEKIVRKWISIVSG